MRSPIIQSEAVPRWFEDALAHSPSVDRVEVDGTSISFRTWGESSARTHDLLLVHGGAAHAQWWDHLAPLLARDRKVVAVDMSGHGESGRRGVYSLDGWADELAAVIGAAGLAARPVIAGHSMGGVVTAVLAGRGIPVLTGAIIIDSPIEPTRPASRAEADGPAFGNARVYASEAEAVARFRPIPRQSMLSYTAEYIARASVREVPGGWSWKFDPSFARMTGDMPRTLDGLPCPVVLIAGERGILSDDARREIAASGQVSVVEIPDAGHAIMLDQPLALLDALRGVIVDWDSAAAAG